MKVYDILQKIDNTTTDYIIIKQKIGCKYYDLMKCVNDDFNRFYLSRKKFNENTGLHLVPEFNGVEGCYYCI